MDKKKYELGIVIVSYHSDELTIKMIREQLSKVPEDYLLVVVNNGATMDSSRTIAEAIGGTLITDTEAAEDYSSTRFIIHNIENSGFAKGNNMGVNFLVDHFEVGYLLFSNNDIELVDKDVTTRLIAKIKSNNEIGIIGPKVIGLDGNCQSPENYVPFWDEILWMTWGRFLHIKSRKTFDRNSAPEGFYYRVMGSFFLTSCADYLKCGEMDENTFLYGEEVILSERMKRIGKKAYYLPSVSVIHAHGQTTSKYINLIRGSKITYKSITYYFKTYRGVSPFSIFLSKLLFFPYIYLQYAFRKAAALKSRS